MHIILLILGEIGSNVISLLLVSVFAEVAKVNTEALTTNLGKNIAEEVPRQNIFSYIVTFGICSKLA